MKIGPNCYPACPTKNATGTVSVSYSYEVYERPYAQLGEVTMIVAGASIAATVVIVSWSIIAGRRAENRNGKTKQTTEYVHVPDSQLRLGSNREITPASMIRLSWSIAGYTGQSKSKARGGTLVQDR